MDSQNTKNNLLTLTEAARLTPYSPDYLNLLVRRGKLPAKKIGRNWYTSQEALHWYFRKRSGSPLIQSLRAGEIQIHSITSGGRLHPVFDTTILRWLLIVLAIFLLLLLLFPELVFGMSSPNYRLDQSFIGTGGTRESSGNYQLIETLGDVGTGLAQSANYRLRAGYLRGAQEATLTFSVSATSLNLGTITTSAVASAGHTMTVTTDLTRGFVITAQADGLFRSGPNNISFVADGTVTAGAGEYGARFTGGLGSHPAGDIGLSSLTTVTSHNDNVTAGDTTSVTYRASAAPSTPSGTYSSTTTYIATASF